MSDQVDLSKLSVEQLIAKICILSYNTDPWTAEANAKLDALTVVLKQAVIREAAMGEVELLPDQHEPVEGGIGLASSSSPSYPDHTVSSPVICRTWWTPPGRYYLVKKEA